MSSIVVGGDGRTGKLVVEQLIAHGDTVVASIRDARHTAAMVKLGAETVMLDLETSTGREFAAMFAGADAVVFAAGSAEGEPSALDRKRTLTTLRAAEKPERSAASPSPRSASARRCSRRRPG